MIGGVIGLTVSFAGARLLASLVYGVSPRDPLMFVLAPAVLMAIGLAATAIPALRGTSASPLQSLRQD